MKPKEYQDYPKMSMDDFLDLPFVENVNYNKIEEGTRFRVAKTAYSGQLSSVYVVIGVDKDSSFSVKKVHYRKDVYGIEKKIKKMKE